MRKLKIPGKQLRRESLTLLRWLWLLVTLPIRLLIKLIQYIQNKRRYSTDIVYRETVQPHYGYNTDDDVGNLQDLLECPEFLQYFHKSDELGVGLEYIEMTPDETAVLRIVGESTFSKQYRRRIYTNKLGKKYFKLNGEHYYLRKKQITPIQPTQDSKKR